MSAFQQRQKGWWVYPGRGWRRLLFKAPVVYWRLGLGPIFGRILLLLTTTGRKSGRPRRTMLDYTVMEGRKYVASGWGETRWYKNILADPRVTVQTKDGVERAVAQPVTDDGEVARLYGLCRERARRLPWERAWKQWLDSWDIQDNVEDFVAKKDRLYFLRLDPTDETTPGPVRADLIWVWPLLLLGALLVYFLTRR